MSRLLGIALLFAAWASPSFSQATKEGLAAIDALYSEMLECVSDSTFMDFGLSPAGPCGDLASRVQEARVHDGIVDGVFCTAHSVRAAAQAKVFGRNEDFEMHKAEWEACREILRSMN